MSRVGKKPIGIPDGVTVNVADGEIEAKGPKGTLRGVVPGGIAAKVEEGQLSSSGPTTARSRAPSTGSRARSATTSSWA